jgi:RNA polymerase-associated protein
VLADTIVQGVDLFKVKPFFMSDEFSLVDATIAPILWRLPHYEVELPTKAQPILRYATQIFSRAAFRESLSARERDMRS